MAKPGPTCSVCKHREHAAIDLGIARGVSMTALAQRFGVSYYALRRHAQHLPKHVRAAMITGPGIELDLDRLRETESQSLLANIVALRQRLFAALDSAEEAGDMNVVTRVAGQLHKNFEVVGRLLGQLGLGETHVTNILLSPIYIDMRVGLVAALAPYPEAREAVAAVLHRLEASTAKDITDKRTEYARS